MVDFCTFAVISYQSQTHYIVKDPKPLRNCEASKTDSKLARNLQKGKTIQITRSALILNMATNGR
jgi:hypothetical protein